MERFRKAPLLKPFSMIPFSSAFSGFLSVVRKNSRSREAPSEREAKKGPPFSQARLSANPIFFSVELPFHPAPRRGREISTLFLSLLTGDHGRAVERCSKRPGNRRVQVG